jgi:hypothetical protein
MPFSLSDEVIGAINVNSALLKAKILSFVPDLPNPHELYLKADRSGGGLSIDLVHEPAGQAASRRASFRFDSRYGDVTVVHSAGAVSGDHPQLAGARRRFMGLANSDGLTVVADQMQPDGKVVLHAGPDFVVTPLNQYYDNPLAAPFLLVDAERSYYVACEPAATTVFDVASKPFNATIATRPVDSVTMATSALATAVAAKATSVSPWIRNDARTVNFATAATQSVTPSAATLLNARIVGQVNLPNSLRYVKAATISITFTTFFHPFAGDFSKTLLTSGLNGLFAETIQGATLAGRQPFTERYAPDPARVMNPGLVEAVDFAAGSPFGVYNAELFLHLPLLLQAHLCQSNQAIEGLKWGARVCDLLGVANKPEESWKYLPFRKDDAPSFAELLDSLQAPEGDPRRQSALAQIEASQLYPFQPFRIARLRTDAMKKYAFLQGFKARLALADSFFRRYTPHDVTQALLQYLILDAALGRKPEVLSALPTPAKTYAELRPHLDAADDAVLTIETKLGAVSAVTSPTAPHTDQTSALRLAATHYFCLPSNTELLALWDTIAERLFNIRNGRTIDGVARPLSLFGPRIDPNLLVQAAAAGLDLNAAAEAASSPRAPRFRFPVTLRWATARIDRLAALCNALQQTLEKKDAEYLSAMHSRHEREMLDFIGTAKDLQIAEAEQTIATLYRQRDIAMVRWNNYRAQLGFDDLKEPQTNLADGTVVETGQRAAQRQFKLVDGASLDLVLPPDPAQAAAGAQLSAQFSGTILSQEREEAVLSFKAASANFVGSHLEAIAGILTALPTFEAAAKPMGAGAGVHIGGVNLGGMVSAGAREVMAAGSVFSYLSSNAGREATRVWRERDFAQQLNSAALEALHVDQLIIGAQKAVDSRKQEKINNDEQIKRSSAVLSFLASKFSSEDFYTTMTQQLTQLQKQAWAAALDTLQAAQDCFQFAWLKPAPQIPTTLWNMAPNGLLSGEALHLAAQQLESAYMAEASRRIEVTRTYSLRRLNPFALMSLRETGKCTFMIDEAILDLDDPGMYCRRIESVSLSIPAVTGPDIPINATLQLLDSWIRQNPAGTNYKASNDYGGDVAFKQISVHESVNTIVTSTGREDMGVFTPPQQDERYGPFEGAGVISKWQLTLPKKNRQFSYRTIPDIKVHVRIQAMRKEEMVEPAENGVGDALDALTLQTGRTGSFVLFSARYDFPDDWYRWTQNPASALSVTLTRDYLPYVFRKLAHVDGTASVALWAPTDADASITGIQPISVAADGAEKWSLTLPAPDASGGAQDDCYLFFKYGVS